MKICCNIINGKVLNLIICEGDGGKIKSSFQTFLCEEADFEQLEYDFLEGNFQEIFCRVLEYIFKTSSTNAKRLEEFNNFLKVFKDNEKEIMNNFFQMRIDSLLREVKEFESKKEDDLSFYYLETMLKKQIKVFSDIIYKIQGELEEIKENTKSYEDKADEIKYYEDKIKDMERIKNTINNKELGK